MSTLNEKPSVYAMRALLPVALADDGVYRKVVNPTPGTGIAQSIIAAFSATDALFVLKNPAGSGRRYYMDFLRLIPTVLPASATRSELLVAIDDTVRYSSGGSLLTVRNASMPSDDPSQAVVRAGALTLNAEGANVRRLSRAQLRAAIPVQFEEFIIRFGSLDHNEGTLGGTTAVRQVVNVGPAVIYQGHELIVHAWHPGNAATGASWEFEAGFFER